MFTFHTLSSSGFIYDVNNFEYLMYNISSCLLTVYRLSSSLMYCSYFWVVIVPQPRLHLFSL